jgi:hypothetical protein
MVTRVQTEMTDKPTLMIASGANTATGATACHRVAGERIEEIAIPVVKAVLHRELQYRDDHKVDRQGPCDHSGLATPKSAGARPEPDKPRTIRMTGVRHRPLHPAVDVWRIATAPLPFAGSFHGSAAHVELGM